MISTPVAKRAPSPLLVIGASTAGMWIICMIALWIYAGPARPAERHDVTIDLGDGARIAAGENPLEIPSTWSFQSGDVLVIDNRDDVTHVVGPWIVEPGEKVEKTLEASVPSAFCSIHPSGELTIDVEPRRTDWALTIPPTLLLGPAIGVVILVVTRVFHALAEPEPARRDVPLQHTQATTKETPT